MTKIRISKQRMNKIYALSICLWFFILNTSPLFALEKNLSSPWNPNCEALKKSHLTNPALAITFSERPSIKTHQDYYIVYWNEIGVSIPDVAYKHVFVSITNRNQYELFMFTMDGVIISAMTNADEPITDVFSTESNHGESITTKEGISLTEDMYGGPVRMSDIMLLAYEITPDKLTCMEENRIEESAMAVALILKGTASSDLTAVYKGVGSYNGWITKSRSGNFTEYSLTIIPSTIQNQALNITYKIPEGNLYGNLPFLVGNQRLERNIRSPNWLTALNNALTSKTNDSWKAFLSAAKQNGISEKSISITQKNLNLSTP